MSYSSEVSNLLISRVLDHVRIGIHFRLWNRKNDSVEVPIEIQILTEMLGTLYLTVWNIITVYAHSITEQIERTVSFRYQFLAALIQHIFQCQCLALNRIVRVGTFYDRVQILHRFFVVAQFHRGFGCIQVCFGQTD